MGREPLKKMMKLGFMSIATTVKTKKVTKMPKSLASKCAKKARVIRNREDKTNDGLKWHLLVNKRSKFLRKQMPAGAMKRYAPAIVKVHDIKRFVTLKKQR